MDVNKYLYLVQISHFIPMRNYPIIYTKCDPRVHIQVIFYDCRKKSNFLHILWREKHALGEERVHFFENYSNSIYIYL